MQPQHHELSYLDAYLLYVAHLAQTFIHQHPEETGPLPPPPAPSPCNSHTTQCSNDPLTPWTHPPTVAVLFYVDDKNTGSTKKAWILGNIEEVATVRGTLDERRALATDSARYLQGLDRILPLDKDYRPRVHIDDPNGVFILRWYREVDRRGNLLTGYQNKACAGYRLMEDNDEEPFFWTANVQVISKVYLAKHPTKDGLCTLNKSDEKMLKESLTKKLSKSSQ